MKPRTLAFAAAAFLAASTAAAEVTFVSFGADMRYLDNRSDPGVGLAWIETDFDASA